MELLFRKLTGFFYSPTTTSQPTNENEKLNNKNSISIDDSSEGVGNEAHVDNAFKVHVSKEDWEAASEKIKKEFFKESVEVFSSIAKEFEILTSNNEFQDKAIDKKLLILHSFQNLCDQLKKGESKSTVESEMKTARDRVTKILDYDEFLVPTENIDASAANKFLKYKPIQDILLDFLEILPEFGLTYASEEQSYSYELSDSENASGSNNTNEKNQFENYGAAIRILARMAQFLSAEVQLISTENSEKTLYGGKIGNKIFQGFSESVVVPQMTSLFREWKENAVKLTGDEEKLQECTKNFLDCFLDIAGKERSLIAICSNSVNSKEFGVRGTEEGVSLRDNTPRDGAWSSWVLALEKKINENNSNSDINPQQNYHLSSLSIEEYRNKCVQEKREIVPNLNSLGGNVSVGELRSLDENSLSSTFRFTYEKKGDSFFIHEMACFHLDYRKETLTKALTEIAPAFIKALQAKNNDELRKAIGSILFWMNHPTHFKRGQAAISEFMLKAIVELHNKEMKLVGLCDKNIKNSLPLDQGILLCLSPDEAEQFCLANIHLEDKKPKLIDYNQCV